MSSPADPLDILFGNVEIDRAALAKALAPNVRIDRASGRIQPAPAFRQLTNRQKVLAILLAARAIDLAGVSEPKHLPYSELADLSGMPSGSVGPTIKLLRDGAAISTDPDGAYYLSDHDVAGAIAEVVDKASKPAGPPAKQPSKAKVAPGATTSDTPTQSGKSTPRLPGQSQILDELLASGWFDQPRTIADTRLEIQRGWARKFKSTDLSPYFTRMTRDRTLTRDPTDAGGYAYKRPDTDA